MEPRLTNAPSVYTRLWTGIVESTDRHGALNLRRLPSSCQGYLILQPNLITRLRQYLGSEVGPQRLFDIDLLLSSASPCEPIEKSVLSGQSEIGPWHAWNVRDPIPLSVTTYEIFIRNRIVCFCHNDIICDQLQVVCSSEYELSHESRAD